ncbi:MAG: ATP-binding cassette domain-containing protein [Candidatus Micrarchaeia archaeon]
MKKSPAIVIKNLSKHFKKLRAVDRISLEVVSGEVFALLGPNGAGKTTTISMLCGLLMPTSGSADVAGFDVSKDPISVRKMIGVVFQQPSVDDLLSGQENLEMHALLYGVPAERRKGRIADMLRLVGLTERKDSQVKEYSGGMRKRLEIARGILHWPKILFLDEPTVGLDPQTRAHIWQYIRKMSQREGTTVVFTTHYLEEAEQFADRVAIIDHGKIIEVGTPKEMVASLGGDSVRLSSKNPKATLSQLRKMKFTTNVRMDGTAVIANISKPQQNLPRLLKTLSNVDSVEIHTASLNDVFIKYTGRAIREESGEGGFMERIMNRK